MPHERPRQAIGPARTGVVLVAVALMLAGCSRLDFVKPDPRRRDFERTAPEIELRRQGPDATALVQRGQQSLLGGDLEAAEDSARKAVRIDSRSAAAHTLLALVADGRNQGAKAGEHYRQAFELAPNNGVMLNNYAAWLCGAGRAGDAMPLFERAAMAPGYATPGAALANAGLCAGQAGMADRSEAMLRRALELDPANVAALGAMAEQEFLAGRAFEARAFSERRLAAGPADRRALELASQIEEKLGDKAAAAKYVQRIRVEFPALPDSVSGDGNRR
ncbi:type IV pilus biogenesis/stability protein PilW [Aerolutibacter ruishenii]|uniref:Type IV pilus assembly protein PilF n=1 Tax=Aerolutibacter ruishenii TaxID=686800 RepID=A0A562LVJ9_9GAMM|nr:type IV pilus biogenesis/stability protein PilW [Lysobacter ruishenii]TWI11583.1 type IV pilus assembly protein PilF [Lysobacter ruishenii]